MDSSNVYEKISNLQSEVHDLENRQTIAEVQLEHILEERRWGKELRTKIWRGLSLMMWFAVGFLMVILFISLHYSR